MNLSALAAALARLLTPSKNFPGLTGLGFAAYALAQSLAYGHSIGDPRVWQPALAAFLAFMGREFVTPVADPRVPGKLITDLTPQPAIVKFTGDVTSEAVAALRKALAADAAAATLWNIPVTQPGSGVAAPPAAPQPEGTTP